MTEPVLSVVMPVYQTARWLDAAVQSVLRQTARDFELILVDDASPDECGARCDRFAALDERIRVIHRPQNGGLSEARNTGLAAARGRYVFFMDSDDTVEPSLLHDVLIAEQVLPDADWIVFGLTEEHYDENGRLHLTKTVKPVPQVCAETDEMRRALMPLESLTVLGYAWNKLYRREFLVQNNLRFQSVELIEDILFNIDCARRAQNMVVSDACGYHYARREKGSLTGRVLERYFELNSRRVEALLSLHDEWGLTDESVLTPLAAIYARYILSALERLYDPRRTLTHAKRRAWVRELRQNALYRRLRPSIKGLTGFLVKTPGLALPAGLALHIMHARLNGLFRRLRTATNGRV